MKPGRSLRRLSRCRRGAAHSGERPPGRWRTSLFDGFLMPDGRPSAVPIPSLAWPRPRPPPWRVGTFVLAASLRNAQASGLDAHTLTVLTDGRFDY